MSNSFRKMHMISHKVKDPRPIDIRLITEFENNHSSQHDIQQILAHFVLYSPESVYTGKLKKYQINSQLSWNQNCVNALIDSLSGKKSNIQIKFDEAKLQLGLICQIESGINIKMFEINLIKQPATKPMQHMKETFMNYKNIYFEQETKIKQQKQIIQQQIRQMQALEKQIQDQTITEVAHLKRNFLDVINACKGQLRRYMKSGVNEIVNEQDEQQQQQAKVINKRTIRRVNREPHQPKQIQKKPIVNEENVNNNRDQYEDDDDNQRFQNIF